MDVSGQLHASATVTPGKYCSRNQRIGREDFKIGLNTGAEKFLSLPGI